MRITQPFDYPYYTSKIYHEDIVRQSRRLLERLEWGLFSSQGSFEGVDKGKLLETITEANKSLSGGRPYAID